MRDQEGQRKTGEMGGGGEEVETSMDGGATDVPERTTPVSNNRDRTSQYELELVAPEIQETRST